MSASPRVRAVQVVEPDPLVDHPARNRALEARLTERGFPWEFVVLDPLDVDVQASLNNQARVSAEALDNAVVAQYADAVTNGDVFPAILVAEGQPGTHGLLILSGNHRFHAHLRAEHPLVAYRLTGTPSPTGCMVLTFEENATHGKATTVAERTRQAMILISAGMSHAEAGRRLGLTPRTVSAAVAYQKACRRADVVDISRRRWDSLPVPIAVRLNTISTDVGFRAMTLLALNARLNAEQVKEAVAGMAELRSEDAHVKYVKALVTVYAEQAQDLGTSVHPPRGRQPATPTSRAKMVIGGVLALDDPAEVVALLTPGPRSEFRDKVLEAIEALRDLAEALQ